MPYTILPTLFSEVFIFEPIVHADERGYFFESFQEQTFQNAINRKISFVQDNQSQSKQYVLRGLHYQVEKPQAKLVRVLQGSIFDVAVDIRRNSRSFGKYFCIELSAENKRQLWIPEGFAHGFLVTSPSAEVFYKTSDYYAPEYERCLLWSDPELAIPWPLEGNPAIVSTKDQAGIHLIDVK